MSLMLFSHYKNDIHIGTSKVSMENYIKVVGKVTFIYFAVCQFDLQELNQKIIIAHVMTMRIVKKPYSQISHSPVAIVRGLLLSFFTLVIFITRAQESPAELPSPKRFIDRVEIFAGPGLCFNYGNNFVENYNDDNVENKRLSKLGYTAGVGLYHPINNWLDVNLRFQYEKKGRKTELNHPLNPVNNDARQIIQDDYTYKYFTIGLAPTLNVIKKKLTISVGAYYSIIKGIKGFSRSYNTQDFQISEGEFEGRYFYHLREDGGMDSFTWIPGLKSFQPYDIGSILSIGYSISFKNENALAIQLVDNFGFKNINKDVPYDQEERNHTLSLILSYTLKRPNKK
jgi:hypothetical protein